MNLLRLFFGKKPGLTLLRIAVIAPLLIIVFRYVYTPAVVHGVSMEPTIADRSLRVIDRMRYTIREPQRGDVVAIRMSGYRHFYLKRIVGLPGEQVQLKKGQLIINGKPYAEPYVMDGANLSLDIRLNEDEFYVMGDNRKQSIRGITKKEHIIGVLLP